MFFPSYVVKKKNNFSYKCARQSKDYAITTSVFFFLKKACRAEPQRVISNMTGQGVIRAAAIMQPSMTYHMFPGEVMGTAK